MKQVKGDERKDHRPGPTADLVEGPIRRRGIRKRMNGGVLGKKKKTREEGDDLFIISS